MYAIARQSEKDLVAWVGDPDRIPFPAAFGCDPTDEAFRTFGAYDDFQDELLHVLIYIDVRGRALWHDIGNSPFMDIDFFVEETVRLRALYLVEDGRAQVLRRR